LSQALTNAFGSAVKIQFFDWSGRNTHSARLKAADDLAQFLDSEGRKYPGAVPVVIGHSHGGNVALYATNHIKDPRNLSNIVGLATPYLRGTSRPGLSILTQLAWFGLSILLAAPIYVALLTGAGKLIEGNAHAFYGGWSVNVTWLFWFVTSVAVYILMRVYLHWSATRRMKSLSWSADVKARLLAIYYRLDEAEQYLTYLNVGSSRLARLLGNIIATAFVAVLAYTLLSFYLRAYAPELFNLPVFSTPNMWWGEGGGPPKRGAWAELVLMSFFALVPSAILIAFLLPLLRGNPWGYGWEWPSTTMMLDISPVQCPAASKSLDVEQIALDGREFKHKGWAHSAIYQDPRVHEKIVDWIRAAAQVQ
jgi:pimeloyl-ACP methyl ester carboxylesterase